MESHFPHFAADRRAAQTRVAEDLKSLVSDTEQLLRATAHDASQAACDARMRVEAALLRARESYVELKERGLDHARVAARRIDDVVHERPYESIAVALGVGVLLGAFMFRRR